jgi:hypothetical protein
VVQLNISTDYWQESTSKPVKDEQEDLATNVLLNPTFDNGLQGWSGHCCKIAHSGAHGWKGVYGRCGTSFAIATDRREEWQGIEQEITALVQENVTYNVSAVVRTSGLPRTGTEIIASVRLEIAFSTPRYLTIGRYFIFLHDLIQVNCLIGSTLQQSCHFLCLYRRNPISPFSVLCIS